MGAILAIAGNSVSAPAAQCSLSRQEIALEVMKTLTYRIWRDTNPEDTLRFHALRLPEVGIVKTSPNKLIARSTDWRFLNELRRELKA